MTQDEIIEMARQAGATVTDFIDHCFAEDVVLFTSEELEAFAKLVAEKERERISQKIAQLPFGDTAQSFSIWVKNDT
jgi:hypothetical protein